MRDEHSHAPAQHRAPRATSPSRSARKPGRISPTMRRWFAALAAVPMMIAAALVALLQPANATETLSVPVAEDAYVSSCCTRANYGTASILKTDTAAYAEQSFLKFNLGAYAGRTVESANLVIRTGANSSTTSSNVKAVADTAWTETGLNYGNKPALGATHGAFTPSATNTAYTIPLTASVVQAALGGNLALGLDANGSDGAEFQSDETTGKATLTLKLADATTPSPSSVSTTSPLPTTTSTTPSPTSTTTASSTASPTATASTTSTTQAPSTTCTGGRVFAEAQAWWTKAPGASATSNDFGHIHVGACVPERDTLTASTTIPVRVIMHGNPGTLLDMSVVFKGTDYETTVAKVVPAWRKCAETTCEQWLNAPIDITKFGHSGLQEIRFRVFVDEPDGQRMHTSINWQTSIANGMSKADVTRMPYLRGKGWYTGFGYCEPDILSIPLPDKPVSGTLKLRVQQIDHGSGDVDPSHHRVALDSDAHAGIPGTVLVEGDGSLAARDIDIDTTKLSNGPHRLVQRVDCRSGEQINSGVLVLRFEVNNP
jgi:hypothetical protein